MSNAQQQQPIHINVAQQKIKSTLITFGVGVLVGAIALSAIWFWVIGPATASGALARATDRVEQLEGLVSELSTETEQLTTEVGDLRIQHESDIAEISLLNQSLDGLTNRLGEISGELRRANEQLSDARGRLADATSANDEHIRRIASLETRVGELTGELNGIRVLVRGYGDALKSSISGIDTSDERIRLALDTISGITDEINSLIDQDN